jgi:hypothetical protein
MMGEHVYLRRRNEMIYQLRHRDGMKLEQIVVIINRGFPDLHITKSRLSQILKVPREAFPKLS